jgi:hypothetical protein
MTPKSESIVNDYMRRLEQQLNGLPPDVARDVASQVREHIATALSAIPNPSESDVRNILDEVGPPQTIARAAAVDFPSTAPAHRVSLHTLAFWGYVLWFGALWGYNPASFATMDPGMALIAYLMAFTGAVLVSVKNRRIIDKRLRNRISLSDFVVAGTALAIDFLTPPSLGMLRGPVLLVLFVTYMYRTRHVYWDQAA